MTSEFCKCRSIISDKLCTNRNCDGVRILDMLSNKQSIEILKLCMQLGIDLPPNLNQMTKKQASEKIQELELMLEVKEE